jgi:acyl-CoA thioesterase
MEFSDAVMPPALTLEESIAEARADEAPPIRDRYESRRAIGGAPFSASGQALAGGWIRAAGPRVVDAALAAAFMDGWLPALAARDEAVPGVPTVDLTVHFRTELPLPGARADDWYLVVFRTLVAASGFVEEDGELWSADGRLLAQSRQLAVMIGEIRSRP